MPRTHIGAAAAALTLGFALLAAGPAAATPITPSAEITDPLSVIPVAKKGTGINPAFRRVTPFTGPGLRLNRTARLRSNFFRPGRRLWLIPALGAAAVALTLAPGWYWGDYYDECHRWIVPCPGCAPQLFDLCSEY